MIKDNNFLPPQAIERKYHNEDYLMRMFIKKDPQELENIKKAHGLSDEKIKLFCDFATLREETIKEMRAGILARKAGGPEPSPEELSMGAYQEQIEPPVRETVINLRRKGYNTYESGFSDFDTQVIGFTNDALAGLVIPEELEAELVKDGVSLEIKPNSVVLKFRKYQDAQAIAGLWKKVERYLPDLGKPAEPCAVGAAVLFREKFSR